MACRLEEGPFCAPCGAVLAGASVALTFSYDYFDVVVLDSEFEVRLTRANKSGQTCLAGRRCAKCVCGHAHFPLFPGASTSSCCHKPRYV